MSPTALHDTRAPNHWLHVQNGVLAVVALSLGPMACLADWSSDALVAARAQVEAISADHPADAHKPTGFGPGLLLMAAVPLLARRRFHLPQPASGVGTWHNELRSNEHLSDDEQRTEELRQARAAAQAGIAAKTEFLSSMSHELRTPLNAVLGFAQLLQRDAREPLSERQRERVAHIVDAGNQLLKLIDDILDLARIEAGRVSTVTQPVDVRDTLRDVMRALDPIASARGITLLAAPVGRGTPLVSADPARFAQILINFGSNAIKYNRAGGEVRLHVSCGEIDKVRITVEDTGIGIPLAKQDLLFQPFQRLGQENGPIEGTGVGLALAQRLAGLMGANIGFRSTPGHGSAFWVDVPVCAKLTPST